MRPWARHTCDPLPFCRQIIRDAPLLSLFPQTASAEGMTVSAEFPARSSITDDHDVVQTRLLPHAKLNTHQTPQISAVPTTQGTIGCILSLSAKSGPTLPRGVFIDRP